MDSPPAQMCSWRQRRILNPTGQVFPAFVITNKFLKSAHKFKDLNAADDVCAPCAVC
jgi:hypothetical protein